MPNPVWPGSLPQTLFIGSGEARQSGVVRFQPTVGPAKQRRVSGNVPRPVSNSVVFTKAQRQTLETFFVTTLQDGALEFDWVDPLTGTSATFRFVEPPAWQLLGGSSSAWQGTLQLEVLP